MKYLILALCLSGCVDPASYDQADFDANQQYWEDVSNHEAFRPEVYASSEFYWDCVEYQMLECYQ